MIAIAALASVSGNDVEVTALALVAVAPDDVRLAATVARELVASRDSLVRLFGARWIARALIAVAVRNAERVAEVSGQALLAVRPRRVERALLALAGRAVAIADGVRVDVSVAVARAAHLHAPVDAGRVAVVAIGAELAPGSEVPLRALQANHRLVGQLHARSVVRTRAALAVVRRSEQSVSVEAPRALVAGVAGSVVLANALARLRVADVGVFVAVARDARHERAAPSRTVPIARRARLAELAQIAFRTRALLDPGGRPACSASVRRLQLDVVQERFSLRRVGGADLDGGQVAQDGNESARGLARLPGVFAVLVQTERVLSHLLVGQVVVLREDRQRYLGAGALEDDVAGRGVRPHLPDQLQAEFEQAIVRSALVAEEAVGGQEVDVLAPLGREPDALAELVVLDVDRAVVVVDGRPALLVLVEVGHGGDDRVAGGGRALGRVAVAEARRAAELVLQIEAEESRLALLAPAALDVLLAHALASLGVAGRHVVQRAARVAAARLAPMDAEVVEVRLAAVALVAGDARLALALALHVALQRAGAGRVAVAADAVLVRPLVEVLSASLAVGPVAVRLAVDAVAAVARQVVQRSVEVAFARESVAITLWKETMRQ